MKGLRCCFAEEKAFAFGLILPLLRDAEAIEGAQQRAIRAAVGWEDVTVEQMRLEINHLYDLGVVGGR